MDGSIIFDPLLPLPVLWAIGGLAGLFLALAIWRRLSGWWLRTLALVTLVLAVANPSLQIQDRDLLSDIVIIVVDESASQAIADRPEQTSKALADLEAEIASLGNIETRIVTVGDGEGDLGTLLMTSLSEAMAEVPRARLAGAVLLTDGQPVPAVPEGLSKGVIDGTTIPWEVTTALKVPELVENHTEFEGTALYTLTFVLAMNKSKYDSLPDDLKAIVDAQSGEEFSVFAGGTQADADGPAREVAVDNGNNIITVSGADLDVWRSAVEPIYDEWIAEMEARGIDGKALVEEARMLIDKYDG